MVPTLVLYALFLVVPLLIVAVESFKAPLSDPSAGWTLRNYADLMHVQYVRFFFDSLLLSAGSSAFALLLAFPVAHLIARSASRRTRRVWINLLVSSLFLEVLIRVYAISVFYGPAGILPWLTQWFGIEGNSSVLVRIQVMTGLLYFMIPMSILTLIGAIENVNPRLCEAALTLGASRWRSVLVTDVACCTPALFSTFLLTFTMAASSFTVSLILGKGFVQFAANLIYERFSEFADFPSGAALSMLMLVFTMLVVYGFSYLGRFLTRTRS